MQCDILFQRTKSPISYLIYLWCCFQGTVSVLLGPAALQHSPGAQRSLWRSWPKRYIPKTWRSFSPQVLPDSRSLSILFHSNTQKYTANELYWNAVTVKGDFKKCCPAFRTRHNVVMFQQIEAINMSNITGFCKHIPALRKINYSPVDLVGHQQLLQTGSWLL